MVPDFKYALFVLAPKRCYNVNKSIYAYLQRAAKTVSILFSFGQDMRCRY